MSKDWINATKAGGHAFVNCLSSKFPQYIKAIAQSYPGSLVIVLAPTMERVVFELQRLQEEGLEGCVSLTSDLFPTQTRKILGQTADGKASVLLMTPELFHHWFSRDLAERESDLAKRMSGDLGSLLSRLEAIVFLEADRCQSTHPAYAHRYRDCLFLAKKLGKCIYGLSYSFSESFLREMRTALTDFHYQSEPMAVPGVGLYVRYCFSEASKRQNLKKLLKIPKSTVLFIPPSTANASLLQELRSEVPELRVFHDKLSPEARLDCLDYYLKTENPVQIVSTSVFELPFKAGLKRFIYWGLPNLLEDFYYELSYVLQGPDADAYLFLCDDDFNLSQELKAYDKRSYQKLIQAPNQNKVKAQFLRWLSDSQKCRWRSLEKTLREHETLGSDCGLCDGCLNRGTSPLARWSIFWQQRRFQVA